jgi:crossover junction endodeoxyribonuclease RusA
MNRIWRSTKTGVYKDSKASAYQTTVKTLAMVAGCSKPLEGPIRLWVSLHPRQPKKATGRPVRCLDLDNAMKAAIDALNGMAWMDDSQVVEIFGRKAEPVEGGKLIVEWEAA